MKKIISLILVIMSVLVLCVGCTNKNKIEKQLMLDKPSESTSDKANEQEELKFSYNIGNTFERGLKIEVDREHTLNFIENENIDIDKITYDNSKGLKFYVNMIVNGNYYVTVENIEESYTFDYLYMGGDEVMAFYEGEDESGNFGIFGALQIGKNFYKISGEVYGDIELINDEGEDIELDLFFEAMYQVQQNMEDNVKVEGLPTVFDYIKETTLGNGIIDKDIVITSIAIDKETVGIGDLSGNPVRMLWVYPSEDNISELKLSNEKVLGMSAYEEGDKKLYLGHEGGIYRLITNTHTDLSVKDNIDYFFTGNK